MAYNQELDKTIWEKELDLGEGNKIVVGVYSYDGKERKIGFKRIAPTKRDDRPFSFRKIGRINLIEARLINEALAEAITKIQEA